MLFIIKKIKNILKNILKGKIKLKDQNQDLWIKDNRLQIIQDLGSSGSNASQIGLLKGYKKYVY